MKDQIFYMNKLKLNGPVSFPPKVTELLDVEGWYSISLNKEEEQTLLVNNLPDTPFSKLVKESYAEWRFKPVDNRIKFTRFLRNKLLNALKQLSSAEELSQQTINDFTMNSMQEFNRFSALFGKVKTDISFKITCRHKDFLRLDSPHYSSCFRKEGAHSIMPFNYCLDRSMALIYIPDKNGNYVWRMFIRLVKDKDKFCLLCYPAYGCYFYTKQVLKELSKLFPIFLSGKLKDSVIESYHYNIFCELQAITHTFKKRKAPYASYHEDTFNTSGFYIGFSYEDIANLI